MATGRVGFEWHGRSCTGKGAVLLLRRPEHRNRRPPCNKVHLIDILLGELRRVLPKATWTAAGIGRHQSEVMRWVLERGGDGVRTGLEDNIRITKERLASSNAELVRVAVDLCAEHDVRPATPAEARSMLGLAA